MSAFKYTNPVMPDTADSVPVMALAPTSSKVKRVKADSESMVPTKPLVLTLRKARCVSGARPATVLPAKPGLAARLSEVRPMSAPTGCNAPDTSVSRLLDKSSIVAAVKVPTRSRSPATRQTKVDTITKGSSGKMMNKARKRKIK